MERPPHLVLIPVSLLIVTVHEHMQESIVEPLIYSGENSLNMYKNILLDILFALGCI